MQTQITIDLDRPIARINPLIYGHFAEHLGTLIYDGLWVGPDSPIKNRNGIRTDVVDALKKIKPPALRWPGGCFADDYHWQDGIGPHQTRPQRLNLHWDAVESNHFGTHEFFELCAQLGCEPYICGNVGSGTVREMRDWVEYMNGEKDTTITRQRSQNGSPYPLGVFYFGIGNENWGCGGNMSPEFYAEEFKRYATYVSAASGNVLFKIACGANGDNYDWTRGFFAEITGNMNPHRDRLSMANGFAIHYYCGTSGTATEYTEAQWYQLLAQALRMEDIIMTHRKVMDGYDPLRKTWLIVDEWGTWHRPIAGTNPRWLMQQNTIRDALAAAMTLDIFNRHADIVYMTNIAQMVNVLQSMILTDGPRMLVTPTGHVYEMYAPHQGGQSLTMIVKSDTIPYNRPAGAPQAGAVPRVSGSCSRKGSDVTLTLVNAHATETAEVSIEWRGNENLEPLAWRSLSTPDIHAHNTFEHPKNMVPTQKKLESCDKVSLLPASIHVFQYHIVK